MDIKSKRTDDDRGISDYEFRCLIPTNSSGPLIGRGGTIIKNIGETTHCRLKVGDGSDPHGTKERILAIRGSSIDNVVRVSSMYFNNINFMLHFNPGFNHVI